MPRGEGPGLRHVMHNQNRPSCPCSPGQTAPCCGACLVGQPGVVGDVLALGHRDAPLRLPDGRLVDAGNALPHQPLHRWHPKGTPVPVVACAAGFRAPDKRLWVS